MKIHFDCRKWAIALTCLAALIFMAMPGAALASGGGGEKSTAAEHGGGGGGSHWAATDTYKVMNFAVLAIALVFLLKKPVAQALSGRIAGIREQLEELEAKKKATEAELASYGEKLAKLETEAQQIVDEYIKQGESAKARILKEAESTAEKMEAQAKKNIAHEFLKAKEQLKREIVDEALAKAEALITDAISSDDQSKLVDEYLQKVVA
ncbi:MAG: ATP synthase F0 subunit B [Pseudomonadota bacterium]